MKHPCGICKKTEKVVNYSHRGMGLEEEINLSNQFYRDTNKAIIYKKPTPITITKVDYPSRLEAKITEAYFKVPSTTDYNGIYKGKYIDFEAKETRNTRFFPLRNIHTHQIEHLKKITEHGGIGFLIVRFSCLNQTYYLSYDALKHFLDSENRKSIPVSYFQKEGFLLKDTVYPRVDYLKIVDQFL